LGDVMRSFEAQWVDHEAVLAVMDAGEIEARLRKFKADYH
jgi:hypothetical protein